MRTRRRYEPCMNESPRNRFDVFRRKFRPIFLGFIFAILGVYVACYLNAETADGKVDTLRAKLLAIKQLVKKCQQPFLRTKNQIQNGGRTSMDKSMIERIIEEEIVRFDVDRTGMTDFAMKSLGGGIVTVFDTVSACLQKPGILGFSKPKTSNPSAILEPNVSPGSCWAFLGGKGAVVVRLFVEIVVTHVSIEHISKDVAPGGDIESAPRIFSVIGLEDPYSSLGHPFGSFIYRKNGPTLQTFAVKHESSKSFLFVRIDFQENHGNEGFTCVYRVRIHGRRVLNTSSH